MSDAPDEGSATPTHGLLMLRRRRGLIVTSAAGLLIFPLAYAAFQPKQYTSATQLLIDATMSQAID
jgi:uncharacterized protein involved in exopolysaccharide biosynthesis